MRSNYNPFALKVILGFILLFCSLGTFSQTLEKPELVVSETDTAPVSFVCASSSSFIFGINISFGGGPFGNDNVFNVILSNADGDFIDGETKNLASITDGNFLFNFNRNISFNDPDIYGSSYRIKIVSDDPAMESPESDPFGAYFRPDVALLIDQGGNADICDGESVTLELNIAGNSAFDDYDFRWYLNDTPIAGETGRTLEVSQAGEYYARFSMGQCTDSDEANPASNKTIVNTVSVDDVSILGEDIVSICSDETYDLVASIDDNSYTYNWYKDDELITGLNSYTPIYTTADADQFGVYHLELISSGGCPSRSQNVVVQPFEDAGFDAIIVNEADGAVVGETIVILPTETIVWQATTDISSSSLSYQWYDQDGARTANTQSEINITSAGEYFVEITDSSSSCPVSAISQKITVLSIDSLFISIRQGTDYVECNVETTNLSILSVVATASDGLEYSLSEAQEDEFSFQWFIEGVPITDATLEEYSLSSYEDNGMYSLYVSVGGGSSLLEATSEQIEVLLSPDLEIVSSSTSNKLCNGSVINLSIDVLTGFNYVWFKDDEVLDVTDVSNVDVSEIGSYYVTYEGFGCQTTTAIIDIVEFDESVLEVSPSTTAVLVVGESTTLTATGADSYEWYNENGDLLSTNDVLDVNSIDVFTLIGSVGECQVEKEVEVVADDGSFIIPNIISPFNGDNVNDTWEIPNKFAFQTDVTVIIYNSRGNEVVNTTDYQNNWPEDNNIKAGMLFYFKVIKEDVLIKAGTISVLE